MDKREDLSEVQTIGVVELAALLTVALCLIFTINLALDWLGRQLGSDIMEWGRRRDLGFVLSLGFGLYLTHKIAAWAGFRPKRKSGL